MTVCPSCGHENSDTAKFCEECAAALDAAPAAREQRKTVTVLFCDVTGSTELGESTDPEALRALLARYFERMKAIVESHGGTVEKFIGDAVMAVFGVPQVHEDDALRAVRAAVEMRDALPELGVQARIGVNTGEVVTGTEERLATGDAVNVAARLEQAAQPGEVLIGEPTLALVRDAVEAEPVEPLELKGKSEAVETSRLLSLQETPERASETPMVGRERERRVLADAWEQAHSERSCHLFTLLGAAGVGKSRLAAEFLGSVEARVVRGRCLSYGEGITYWPAVEVLTQLGTRPIEESAAAAIASVLGETDDPTSPDEIAWAFRKTLEQAAAEGPLVCVFDDIHWAEPAFLDLVEHVADFSRDAPILLLCMARPELLDRRAGWGGGKMNATTVLLEPLSAEETDLLLKSLGGTDKELRAKILEAAEGNPLFVEEMLALVRESNDDEITVPPTIQALLAARLDQLDAAERNVLERGSVEGRVFHQGAVQALSNGETQVPQRLLALVRKELVRPDKSQLPGDDAFRFRHLLIRDAAYEALPKATRAELHERFAHWLEEHGADLVELDEILGYHLEQAARYRQELGQAVDPALAAEARRRLAAAGLRASGRADGRAAVNLLERAASLLSGDETDVAVETALVDALFWVGRPADARRRADSIVERAAAAGDRFAELCGRIKSALLETFVEPEGATQRLEELLEEALPLFEAARDDVALYVAYHARGQVANMHARMDALVDAYERAALHAQQSGLPHDFTGWLAVGRLEGTTPIPELLAWLDEQEGHGMGARLRVRRAQAFAMVGRFEEGRALMAEVRADLADRSGGIQLANHLGQDSVAVEMLAGDAAAAARFGEEGCKLSAELGELSFLSTAAGKLAQAYYALDRLDEAEGWAARAAELGASDDALTQTLWRQTRAKILARRGRHAEAEPLAREAVAIAEETDMLDQQAGSLLSLAEVLELQDKDPRPQLESALALYERKGNLVMAERTRERLESLLQLEQ